MSNPGWTGTALGAPAVGAKAARTRTTSVRDVEMFAAMTGDRNPIHFDETLARRAPFGRLVVQGGVTTGLLNAVVAEDLPGPGTVFLETNWRFIRPVGVGDTITAHVVVEKTRPDKPICHLATKVVNADGETCVEGTAVTFTVSLE